MHHRDDSFFEKFRATILKRIDAFSNVSGFRNVFKCLRFRKRRPPFSIDAVWSRGENVSKTIRFQMKTHYNISVVEASGSFFIQNVKQPREQP